MTYKLETLEASRGRSANLAFQVEEEENFVGSS